MGDGSVAICKYRYINTDADTRPSSQRREWAMERRTQHSSDALIHIEIGSIQEPSTQTTELDWPQCRCQQQGLTAFTGLTMSRYILPGPPPPTTIMIFYETVKDVKRPWLSHSPRIASPRYLHTDVYFPQWEHHAIHLTTLRSFCRPTASHLRFYLSSPIMNLLCAPISSP